jgi:hypothetical protein
VGLRMAHTPDDARPMRREHAFYSRWCQLFDFHLKRLRWSASDFALALKAHVSQQAIHSYLCGRLRPPLQHVPVWAAMLGLRGEERDRFVNAAQEAHVPPLVWKRLLELEKTAKEATEATSDRDLRDRLTLAEGIVQELIGLLGELEALFYTRTVPVDRIAAVRAQLGQAVRRAIERYAKPGLES